MAARRRTPVERRKPFTTTGLIRECGYFSEVEAEALERAAEEKQCSKSEVLRRALRYYLDLKV
jgi:hypothetical protein